MEYFRIALQLIVGLSLLNVWLVQNKKPTRWRGGNATTIIEEFQVGGFVARLHNHAPENQGPFNQIFSGPAFFDTMLDPDLPFAIRVRRSIVKPDRY